MWDTEYLKIINAFTPHFCSANGSSGASEEKVGVGEDEPGPDDNDDEDEYEDVD